jgi:hypothetical protein
MEVAICFNPIFGDGVNFQKRRSASTSNLEYYYKNICVAFESIRFFNPKNPLVLYTSSAVPDRFVCILKSINVKTVFLEPKFIFPSLHPNRFAGSLYLLDCISKQTKSTLYLDPDVICLTNLNEMEFCEDRISVFDASKLVENIPSINRLKVFSQEQGCEELPTDTYFGGEMIYLPQSQTEEVQVRISEVWRKNLKALKENSVHLETEEHVLTLALYKIHNLTFTKKINRIWTTRSYRNIPDNLSELGLIHLPAEKDKGISQLFQDLYTPGHMANSEIFAIQNRDELFRKIHISLNFKQRARFKLYKLIKLISRRNYHG